jgi:hypothetical protein
MKFTTILLAMAGAAVMASGAPFTSSPSDVCPAPYAGSSDAEGVASTYLADTTLSGSDATGTVTGNTGCNVLITFNANGSITTTFPNAAGFYDSGGDDNMVGIINNTSSAITSIALSSAVDDIFGFDGDGPCGTAAGAFSATAPGYTFVGGVNPCTNSIESPSGNTGNDYGGPYVTFTGINGADTAGTVNFGNGGIAAGGSTWFGLEGPVDVNLTVSSGVPEPGSLALLGSGLAGLAFLVRKRRAAR